ncbi:MAG: DUF1320 domain-containing protein [Cohaesibacter sp.]|jgi:phage gp36-like protein|nr:DUF1320 domain-containing protein [Cohaesibacter sp.]
MDIGVYLTVDELVAMHDESDLIALAGIGGHNSANGRTINRERLQSQIKRAQSLITGYIGSRYPSLSTLPNSEIDDAVKGAVSDLIMYWLRDRVADKSGVTEEWSNRYRAVIAWLKDIQAGKVDLTLPEASPANQSEGGVQYHFPTSRIDDILKGY